jgi:hypothetical protein
LVEEGLVTLLLVLEVVVLVAGLFGLSDKDVTVALVVPNDLVNGVVNLEEAIFVGELGDVGGRLGVVGGELLVDGFVTLLLGQILLVGLHVSFHVEKFVVILQVFGHVFFLKHLLGLLGLVLLWWHF